MNILTTILNKYGSDKGNIVHPKHSFGDFYEKYFMNITNAKFVLEIGIHNGSSILSWKEYFKEANIHGIDIDDKSIMNDERITCYKVDQSNIDDIKNFVKDRINNNILYDVIIDDGSHRMEDQQLSFINLFKILKSNGLYIIEDLHTSLCEQNTMMYGKPLFFNSDRSNSTLSFLKNENKKCLYATVDEQNYLNDNIKSIEIYDKENIYPGSHTYKNRSITSMIQKK